MVVLIIHESYVLLVMLMPWLPNPDRTMRYAWFLIVPHFTGYVTLDSYSGFALRTITTTA
jgi:hypothetical protein